MNRRPKVLFVARRFPPSVGGMQRFAYELSQSLVPKCTRLDIIAWGGSNKWMSALALPWLFVRALYKLISFRDYDILHMQDGTLAPAGWLLHKLSGKPYVVVAHGLDVTYDNALYKPVLWFIRQAAMVISISRATEKSVLAIGVPSEHSTIITLGVSMPGKQAATKHGVAQALNKLEIERSRIILTVGRLVKRKGVAWFIENVLPKIIKAQSDAVYLVVGEGSERPALEGAVQKKHLGANVWLLGEVTEELKQQLYQVADVFVMPNIPVRGDMEGFGLVALEAAAAGLPVVASRLEGIADALTDGENAKLVEPKDAEAFAAQITSLLENSSMCHRLGSTARTYTLKHFAWDNVAERYAAVYRQLIKG